ncbi:hypothetical protein A2763_02365 [Candidatus Kaiserbacteria bacterium RIFCSPHIGHO2_01_FULL_54_36]|uniref:Uncharacterized protein n=1 Tax=Candidatus Kaiserbacteria bacterium RIFCSPHIGHO2_01_FULL_54_36 TaxID=1798482 RepID=A0A1F6CNP4_9BACT|nr:MAG: hypothetical protein A2763_02365 [Candidatus Kaiserbacteria bacterium RIFCSPHIGHO2_01_FULL_54_36]OGG76003.1 MAG: hypothetical protein A3A41_03470 [Candidatus Kaiserbacteria bacterium RIFCSPLOWO2_01_FULL_54_22]
MRIVYAGVPVRKRAMFKKDILTAIAEAHDSRVKFVRSAITEHEISVMVELEENEVLKRDIVPLIAPILDVLATLKLNAKCSVKKHDEKKPSSTWHRWSRNTKHAWY